MRPRFEMQIDVYRGTRRARRAPQRGPIGYPEAPSRFRVLSAHLRALRALCGEALRAPGPLLAAIVLTLPGCGFQLRGQAELPFKTVAVPARSPVGVDIARNIQYRSGTRVVDTPAEADAVLNILGESRERAILSLNTQGQVQEYTLRYRLRYQVVDSKGGEFVPPSEILLRRDITFNNQVLAKEQEEELLYRDMRSDAVQQIMRRLSAAKLQPAGEVEEPLEPALFE